MAIDESILMEIKYKNDIETVISPYINLKRRGKNLVGLCPFHSEKTPSFTVYPESGSFYCYGCGVGGDVFTFVKLAENLDYIEAVKKLAESAGVNIPEDGYDNSLVKLKAIIYEINRESARFFHNYIFTSKGKWALDYLTNRGLSVSTIKHFGLGAAPDGWTELCDYLKSKGYKESDLLAANVAGKSSNGRIYDRFRKRVMFPIIDVRSNVIAFSGRAAPDADKSTGKYVNTSDTLVYKKSLNLFGMNFAKNSCSERIILVEGNMDVVSLHQAGFTNTVAALGTSFTEQQANILSRYTKEIVLILDSDAAGQKAVKRALETVKNMGISVRVVIIPEGKDPDEFIKTNGPTRFKALIEGAVSDIEYKLLIAADGLDLSSDDGKLKYLQNAAEVLAATSDSITRDLYTGKLSDKFGVSKTAIQTKIKQIQQATYKQKVKKEISDAVTDKFNRNDVNPDRFKFRLAAKAEDKIISILFKHPDFYKNVSNTLSEESFITEFNRRVAGVLFGAIKNGKVPDIMIFDEKFTPSEIGSLVALTNNEAVDVNPKAVLMDSIRVLEQEKNSNIIPSTDDMSLDEWAELMKNIANNKKGE